MPVSKRVVLHFPRSLIEKPITYDLVKKYDVMFNILKAKIAVDDGEGLLLMELSGSRRNLIQSLDYLKAIGVKTELLSQDIVRVEDQCTHCGVCAGVCPTAAFYIRPPDMTVELVSSRCIGCEECVKVCPYAAIKVMLL
jgi:ferredoxin